MSLEPSETERAWVAAWDGEWRAQWWHQRWWTDAVIHGNRRKAILLRAKKVLLQSIDEWNTGNVRDLAIGITDDIRIECEERGVVSCMKKNFL